MKKNICLYILGFLIVILSFSSCRQLPSEAAPHWIDYFNLVEENALDIHDLPNHAEEYLNVPINELSKCSFKQHEIVLYPRDPQTIYLANVDICAYTKKFPVEYLKVLDDNCICVCTKLEKEKGEWTYAYIVFNRTEKSWGFCGEYYFITNALSYKDYSNIKIGDSLTEVYEMDVATLFDIRPREVNPHMSSNPHLYGEYYSVRLLTDGILIYQFRCDVPGQMGDDPEALLPSSYIITDITFYEYGNADTSGEKIPLTISQYLDKLEFPS